MRKLIVLLGALAPVFLSGCGAVRLTVETNNLGPLLTTALMRAAEQGGRTLCDGKGGVREERTLRVESHSPDPAYRHPVPGMRESSQARFTLECEP